MIIYSSISKLILEKIKNIQFLVIREKKTIVEILLKNFKLHIKDLQAN